MQPGRLIVLSGLVALSIALGIEAGLRFTQPKHQGQLPSANAGGPSIASQVTHPAQPATPPAISASLENTGQPNTLELPEASVDFVGYWGGHVHSSIQRLNQDFIGQSPDRVSVVFGRAGDTIFIASELYSSQEQKFVRRPTARVVRARTAIVEYQTTDNQLYYIHSHRFQLNGASIITYHSRVDVYERSSRALVGIVTARATLKRLRTPREQLEFARPSRFAVPRAGIWARAKFTRD
jgi:hypothetical protein